jgi:hypothetical protein
MNKIEKLTKVLEENNHNWKEVETKRDLFQFNYYMRFFNITDIDKQLFKNKEYKKVNIASATVVDEIFKDVLEDIEEKHDSYIAKSYFVKLLPQKYPSRQYYDVEEYEDTVLQVCIPILTNDKNSFCIDDKILYPYAGDELFIGSDSLFAVYNLGETDIVYLCADLIPKIYFK